MLSSLVMAVTDERDRHGRQSARRADGADDGDGPAERCRSDHGRRIPSAGRDTPGRWGQRCLFSPLSTIVSILVRNPIAPVRIESIECDVQIEPGRKTAILESVRLASETIEPGHDLKAIVTLKPHKGERETHEIKIPIPRDFPEGPCELVVCDAMNSVRRQFRNDPAILEPRDLDALVRAIRVQTDPKRTSVYLHIPSPERGVTIKGQALPNLPGSVRSALRVETRNTDAADPERHRGGAAGELGRGRHANAAIYRGQGCRVVVIVVGSLRR